MSDSEIPENSSTKPENDSQGDDNIQNKSLNPLQNEPNLSIESEEDVLGQTEEVKPQESIILGTADKTEDYDKLQDHIKAKYDKLANMLYMFPNSILREINELIDTDKITSAKKLQAIVKDRYKGSLEIPGDTAFRAYVVVRKKKKSILDKAKKALEEPSEDTTSNAVESLDTKTKSIYQDLTLSVENKKSLLESLIELCNKRINAIREIQELDPSASYEGVLSGYIREVRSITETLIKLRNELKSEGEREIEVYINSKLAGVIRSTIQAYVSVHGGDKVDLFKTALKLKLKDNKLEELSSTNI